MILVREELIMLCPRSSCQFARICQLSRFIISHLNTICYHSNSQVDDAFTKFDTSGDEK